ncbi:SH3 domain-containing protein [Blastomonas aquatica]|uniref:DUF1579 domain-containing protein n=1 Tax=Blastomonas aquatica TaxID=1510276 RepID=A0ABQ1JQK1_9SPHN|nr:hypothetical protein [Blastomonas aquatica]GGB74779.1 hypothetical protein GCM10010833_32470 [Blastomonas aquatica]
MRKVLFCCLILTATMPVHARSTMAPAPVDLATARASMVGAWQGTLEYRDYTADRWFSIPVRTQIAEQGDGATMIRSSDFDDGPTVGNVRITSVELFDPAAGTVSVGTFRKGRVAEVTTYAIRIAPGSRDATHWTIVEEAEGSDDDRPATLRLTTVRDGDTVETLKEVDFLDDDAAQWLVRNRTRLTRTSE